MASMPIEALLGEAAEELLGPVILAPPKAALVLPGTDFVERAWLDSDRPLRVLAGLQRLLDQGRLAGTGHLFVAALSPAGERGTDVRAVRRPRGPAAMIELALEGGCSAVVGDAGWLGGAARRYAHRIPFVAWVAAGEAVAVTAAAEIGAVGVVIHAGEDPNGEGALPRQVAERVREARALGLVAVVATGVYGPAADGPPGVELAVGLGADLVWAFESPGEGAPLSAVREAVAAASGGRVGLLGAGGWLSAGASLPEAVREAVVNKRGGGMGLVVQLEAGAASDEELVASMHLVQDVYRRGDLTVA